MRHNANFINGGIMADVTMTVPSGVTSTQIGGVSYATSASGTISVPAEYATELLDAGYLPGLPIGMITGVDSSAVAKIGESGGSPTWNSGAWPGGTSSGIGEFDDTWVPTFNVPIDPYNGGDYNPAHMMFYDGAEGGGDTCSIIGRRQKIGNITFGIITFTITSTNSSLTIPNNGVYITN